MRDPSVISDKVGLEPQQAFGTGPLDVHHLLILAVVAPAERSIDGGPNPPKEATNKTRAFLLLSAILIAILSGSLNLLVDQIFVPERGQGRPLATPTAHVRMKTAARHPILLHLEPSVHHLHLLGGDTKEADALVATPDQLVLLVLQRLPHAI